MLGEFVTTCLPVVRSTHARFHEPSEVRGLATGDEVVQDVRVGPVHQEPDDVSGTAAGLDDALERTAVEVHRRFIDRSWPDPEEREDRREDVDEPAALVHHARAPHARARGDEGRARLQHPE